MNSGPKTQTQLGLFYSEYGIVIVTQHTRPTMLVIQGTPG